MECPYLNGGFGIGCDRGPALRAASEKMGGGLPVFAGLVPTICNEESNTQRRDDCPAFEDIERNEFQSRFAQRR